MDCRYVEAHPGICNGQPVLTGTRIPVTVILDRLEAGGAISDILEQYPELQSDQVAGAIRFCRSLVGQTELEPASG
jgi:uncharacterized protein (DUF433 family)